MKYDKICEKYNFNIKEDIPNSRRFIGTCVCGVNGVVAYDSMRKEKFCRNKDCIYYLPSKKFDSIEMEMIAIERGCKNISINGKGVQAEISFECLCTIHQKMLWRRFYDKKCLDKWCLFNNCKYYRTQKEFNTDILKQWFAIEGYKCHPDFKYKNISEYFDIECPNKHIITMNMNIWIKNPHCKICSGDGRTFSYNQMKQKYEEYGYTLAISEYEYIDYINDIIPYKCSEGHIIDTDTYNGFNNRINQQLNPCKICREKNNYESRKNTITELLKDKGIQLLEFNHTNRIVKYKCVCGQSRQCSDSQCFNDTFKGCCSCNNPFSNPEIKNKIKATNIEKYGVENVMHNKDIYIKHIVDTKPYTLPSGKIINLRGYEDKCTDLLLQEFNENEILFDYDDIKEIPTLQYINPISGETGQYYPDMYIPTHRIIVEAKSTYYFQSNYLINRAKIDCCIDKEYIVWLYVIDSKNNWCRAIFNKNDITISNHGLDFLTLVCDSNTENEIREFNTTNKCNECGLVFNKISKLKQHVDEVHKKIRKFQCQHCSYSGKRRDHLKDHIKRKH